MTNIKTFTFNNICKLQKTKDIDFICKQIELYCERIHKKDIENEYWYFSDIIYKWKDCLFIISKENWLYKWIESSINFKRIYNTYWIDYKVL